MLERDRGPPVLGQQCVVKLAADMHTAAEAAFRRDGDPGLTVLFVLDLSRVAGVAIDLDESVNGREPLGDLGGFPGGGVAVGNTVLLTEHPIAADEAPDVTTKDAVFAALVERLQMRVVGAHDGLAEHLGQSGNGNGLEQVGAVGPVGAKRFRRSIETKSQKLSALSVERQSERALLGDELAEQAGIDLADDRGSLLAGSDRNVFAAVRAANLLAPLHIDLDMGRHELDELVVHVAVHLLFTPAQRTDTLILRNVCSGHVALDARNHLHRTNALALLLGLIG